MSRLLIATSIFAILSGAAYAADLAPQAVEPVAPVYTPYNWSGVYVGIQAGYQWSRVSGPFSNIARTASGPYAFNSNGGLVGGFAGYNYQYNNFVLGAEADINASFGNKHTDRRVLYAGVSPWDITGKQEWTGSARLRLGYAIDRFLPYITGGLAFGDVKMDYRRSGGGPILLTHSDNRVGWTIGAGVEYAVTDNWIVRAEYRYTDLGTKSFTDRQTDTYERVKYHSNAVLIGASYKF